MSTKVGEPADIVGNGGWKKGRASLGEIIWSLWGKVRRGVGFFFFWRKSEGEDY